MTMPDEGALRRPEFQGGTPVKLSNGQEWSFPTPTIQGYYPRQFDGGRVSLVQSFGLGPDYDVLTDRYCDLEDDDHAGAYIVLAEIAFLLLSLNYTLGFGDLMYLLRVDVGGDVSENRAMWNAIAAIALGKSPKPIPVGDEPA